MSDPVTLDMSTAQPIQAAPVTLDMSTAKPIEKTSSDAVSPSGFWDTLGREGKSMGENIAGIPAAVYHAFADPPTQDEKAKFGADEVAGPKRVGLGIHRLAVAPVETAAGWYSDALRGKIPGAYEQALSVAPEAMGGGAAGVVAPKLAAAIPGAAGAVSDAATGTVAKAAASAVPDAVGAALKKLPVSMIKHIPYLGGVLTDVYKAGAEAYQTANKPPTYPGAPLPEHPGTFPGAHLPEKPPVYPGAPLPEHPGIFPGAPEPAAPPAEVLQARGLATGGMPTPPSPARALGDIPVRNATSQPAALEPSSAPPVDVSRKAVGQAVDQSLGVEPLKPNVPLREQVPSRLAPKAEPATPPKESSVIKSHVYDPQARELHITTHSNPNTVYVYGDVDPEQVTPFETGSKGKAWAAFKQQSSPLVAKIVNGTRVPVKPMLSAADAAQDVTMNRLAPTAPDDLVDVLKQSVQQAKKNRLAAAAQ